MTPSVPILDPRVKSDFVYGIQWATDDQISIERQMVRAGGYVMVGGKRQGMGLASHIKRFQHLVWPMKQWHRWNDFYLDTVCQARITGIMGPANSAKTHETALMALTIYFCNQDRSTIMVSSTDARSLELRIWGEIKKYYNLARKTWDPPGRLLESSQMIVTDEEEEGEDLATDFRNGIIAIPCINRRGSFEGLGKFVGVKNSIIFLAADELQFMARSFVDSIANLNKNAGFKCVGLGNPKDILDCLGTLTEPHPDLGGWEGIEQGVKTSRWKTRWPDGYAIQFVGTDSPNFDVKDDEPEPFPFLIGRKNIADDLAYYGPDSLQYQMFDLGIMPRNAMAKRVITPAVCNDNGVYDPPSWRNQDLLHIIGLDAAYSSVGGDRTILVHLIMGKGADERWIISQNGNFIVVPIKSHKRSPEDQIAEFVRDYCQSFSPAIPSRQVFYDGTGRATLASAFARIWDPFVQGVEFGGPASTRIVSNVLPIPCKDHFSKFVTELWYMVRYVFEARQFRNLQKEVAEEGFQREWRMVTGNRVEVETKEDMKRRTNRSPDVFDALVTGVEGCRRHGFLIHRIMAPAAEKMLNLKNQIAADQYRNLWRSKQLNFGRN